MPRKRESKVEPLLPGTRPAVIRGGDGFICPVCQAVFDDYDVMGADVDCGFCPDCQTELQF